MPYKFPIDDYLEKIKSDKERLEKRNKALKNAVEKIYAQRRELNDSYLKPITY